MRIQLLLPSLLVIAFMGCTSDESAQVNTDQNDSGPKDSSSEMQVENVDEILKQYDSPTRDYWQNPDLVIEKIGSLNGKVVADVGVATGYFTFRMAQDAKSKAG